MDRFTKNDTSKEILGINMNCLICNKEITQEDDIVWDASTVEVSHIPTCKNCNVWMHNNYCNRPHHASYCDNYLKYDYDYYWDFKLRDGSIALGRCPVCIKDNIVFLRKFYKLDKVT